MSCAVRYAAREELERVNELRAMVAEVHANGRPDVFRPDFNDELRAQVDAKYDADDADVIVALTDGVICGFAIVEYIDKPPSPYSLARRFYRIAEFGVDAAYRRMGVASALMDFCKREAISRGYDRVELDVWEFNQSAVAFYDAVGFRTYRRYMELKL